ncbi:MULTISPECIES: asparagine synthase (glutamine-hydrolyzing) [Spirulina sp. CCY15215]|uniref:asparagine synthase (glutamine-hydrolyzing) n=1 Tax=Spirulina sp. CCY15215 TaxID=2767591 RepID=UPI001951898E
MCGIAGYSGTREISPSQIQNCLELMKRRGPDSSNFRHWRNQSDRNIYFLHTRLSIIDLDERADQPFKVGSKWTIFNGELYNYLEVRSRLKQSGNQFKTKSDTEVLLQGIDSFGWQALNQYEGMWAFAVYDELDGSLTLCRDRFGEKPLYIYQESSGLYFASEIKFLQALVGKRFAIDENHLCRYIINGYKALYKKPHSFFENVSEVPSASLMQVSAEGDISTKRYWQPCFTPDNRMTYENAVAEAREHLIEAVKIRLRADVPIAFCMSGGVDSNTLISIAKRLFNYDVRGFTIVNTDARYEEQDLVDYAVAELGIKHTSIPIETHNFLAKLRELIRYHDAPVYTITYYAHWLLMENVSDRGYRIAVSGTAADELFTGYYDHHLAYLYEIRNELELYETSLKAWKTHILPIVRNPYLKNPNLFVENSEFRDHIFLNAEQFSNYFYEPWQEAFTETKYTDSILRNRTLNELFHEATPAILHEDDLNAMYFSIENRSPFLDRSLFEFCHRIPCRHLMQDGRTKAILRDAMRGIVPDKILTSRRKVGFNAPIFDFLDLKNPEVTDYLLDRSPIFERVRRDKIEQLLSKSQLPNSESKFLFYFLNSKIFLEEFAE